MIELIKPEFVIGNEKRFFEFVSSLNEKEKIALISHTDLDGIAAAKIANEVLKADIVKFLGYDELNTELVKELKKEKVRRVVFTDLSFPSDEVLREISKFALILVIDHHKTERDYNTDKITFLSAQGFCTGYLCYYLFSKIQDLEKLDWLAACSCISDFMYFSNQMWMSEIFEKYGDKFEVKEGQIRKTGRFWELQARLSLALLYFKDNTKRVYDSIGEKIGDIGDLGKYADEVNEEISKFMKKFEEESEVINGVSFWNVYSKFHVEQILINILSSKYPSRTFMFVSSNENRIKLSARRQDRKVDLPALLKKLLSGFKDSSSGGHIPAAGASFRKEDLEEFKERLREIK